MKLLSVSQDAKTVKGEAHGWLTAILYMLPHLQGGLGNLCIAASPECASMCLDTAGRGVFQSVREARMRRTREFFAGVRKFIDRLCAEIRALQRKARRLHLKLCVRLNGLSDVPWERMVGSDGRTLMETFPDVQFYDYTKRPNREALWPNYHLTFSRSELNGAQCLTELSRGRNVAVVFSTKRGAPLPAMWNGYRVIDGDLSDLRFLDPRGVVVGLRAKGRARRAKHGFVEAA